MVDSQCGRIQTLSKLGCAVLHTAGLLGDRREKARENAPERFQFDFFPSRLGKAENDTLQRIYATAFPSEKELKVHKVQMEEAAKRDHRAIGLKQDLYFFHDFSAGSCFWMPHGARIFNKLIQFMRREYDIRGFQEVKFFCQMENCSAEKRRKQMSLWSGGGVVSLAFRRLAVRVRLASFVAVRLPRMMILTPKENKSSRKRVDDFQWY